MCIYLFVLDHTIFLYYKIKSKKEILFSIPMFLSTVELVTANNYKDIAKLKAVK